VELGSKNTLLDGRMLLNVAVYNVDWTDMQIQALPSNAPANITNIPVIYRNLGDARSRGIEVETLFAATDNLSFNFGMSVSDPKYKDGTTSFRFAGRCDGVVCPLNTAIGGRTLPRTPKQQLIGGVEWNSTFGNGVAFFARGDVTYQSKLQVEEMNIGQIEPRTLVNGRIGFSRNNWSADIWGKNILNEEYIANSFFIISGTGYSTALGERRTYGMTLRYKF
jgi:iron complex outermembrane receptor protein